MPFDFPIRDEVQIEEAHAEIHALKEECQFDALLSEVIAQRVVSDLGVRNYMSEKKRVKPILVRLVRDHVNPRLAQAILHENKTYGHTLPANRASALKNKELYKKENSVEVAVRGIVEAIYNRADYDTHRKKTYGVVNVIIHAVSSIDFVDALRGDGIRI
jgi:hypothetical protein